MVIQQDILKPLRPDATDGDDLKKVKYISALLGVGVACCCYLISFVSGNLLDVVIKVVNLVVAPLFVLFFLALFVPFATNRGTVVAGLLSLLTAILIAFFGIFGISVLWIMPSALIVGVVSGVVWGYIETRWRRRHSA